jgi:two-component system response regulator MprA
MQQSRVLGKRILVVEDDPSARESLKLLLCIDRHVVTEARDGVEGLAMLSQGHFDLVILDYALPGVRGNEVAANIRRLAPSLPILMVTAYLEKLTEADKPVDAVLGKPFAVTELRELIAGLLAGG